MAAKITFWFFRNQLNGLKAITSPRLSRRSWVPGPLRTLTPPERV
jgi:hypothetical protein